MKDHRKTGVDSVTVPHNDFVGQKVETKSFHCLESDCLIDEEKTKGASKVLHEMLPPPSTNRDWVQKAVAIISKLSGIAVVQHVDAVKQVPCREIAPHIREEIVGDGACFYRTISKAITGTEDNHFAVRMSLINFMLDPANVLAFGRLVRAGIYYDTDALKAVRSHINRHKLYLETSWSTEYE
uniref:OTU domain-containing protein n=1 Tax=Amphimedon queenslandica TaxID=400682 RepID=A0A1X7SST5_AMPQE